MNLSHLLGHLCIEKRRNKRRRRGRRRRKRKGRSNINININMRKRKDEEIKVHMLLRLHGPVKEKNATLTRINHLILMLLGQHVPTFLVHLEKWRDL
jgi:hypothetical protein